VLVSRKWSGKTLADHRADRQAWLLAALGISATDRPGTAGSSSRPATRTIWIMRGGCCMPLPTAPDGKLRSTKPDAELSSRIWILQKVVGLHEPKDAVDRLGGRSRAGDISQQALRAVCSGSGSICPD
jgi:hypothetical protein